MTDRYDHRDDEMRRADAERPEVIDKPVLDGADELRAEATEILEGGGQDDGTTAPATEHGP